MNGLPLPFPIGVAGFVVNDKNEVLLVQEKWVQRLKMVHWKLPGGHADLGESFMLLCMCVLLWGGGGGVPEVARLFISFVVSQSLSLVGPAQLHVCSKFPHYAFP